MNKSIRFVVLIGALGLSFAFPAHAISDKYRDLAARLVTDAEQKLLHRLL